VVSVVSVVAFGPVCPEGTPEVTPVVTPVVDPLVSVVAACVVIPRESTIAARVVVWATEAEAEAEVEAEAEAEAEVLEVDSPEVLTREVLAALVLATVVLVLADALKVELTTDFGFQFEQCELGALSIV